MDIAWTSASRTFPPSDYYNPCKSWGTAKYIMELARNGVLPLNSDQPIRNITERLLDWKTNVHPRNLCETCDTDHAKEKVQKIYEIVESMSSWEECEGLCLDCVRRGVSRTEIRSACRILHT